MKAALVGRRGTRRLWVLWIGTLVLAFILMCASLVSAVSKLHGQANRIYFDSQSLATNRAFEAAVLTEERDALLKRAGVLRDNAAVERDARQVRTLLHTLHTQADEGEETSLVATMSQLYERLHRQGLASGQALPRSEIEPLLAAITRHRDLNARQMEATLAASNRLDDQVGLWSMVLMLGAAVLALAGSLELWNRIFKPILEMVNVAQTFGGGDFSARATTTHDDEMGDLTATFNTMAEAVQNRERERLDFVATVAHDLKNPLMVIGGAAHLLRAKPDKFTPEERDHWLGVMSAQTKRLEALIEDMTDGVQSETGRLTLQRAPFDFAALVREAVQNQQLTSTAHTIHLEAPAAYPIEGDRKRLERAVSNVLSNAVKYSPNGREVEVELQANNGHTSLKVRDYGVGIAPEDLPKLFRPFSRLERTRKMAPGTGLGLASTRKIIEGHGGTITAYSQLGEGTTFEIRLPKG